MSLFDKEQIKDMGDVRESTNSLGGGGVFATGAYDFTITMAYLSESDKGAKSVVFQLQDENKRKLTLHECFLSSDEKGNNPYYITSDQEKVYLPGFENCRDIFAMCSEPTDFLEVEPEIRTIKVYDAKKQGEVDKDMPVFTEILDATVTLGLLKQLEDHYKEPTKSREINVVHTVFETETKLTFVEKSKDHEEGAFFEAWLEKFNDTYVNDRRDKSKASGAADAAASAGVGGAEGGKQTSSLFKKKK